MLRAIQFAFLVHSLQELRLHGRDGMYPGVYGSVAWPLCAHIFASTYVRQQLLRVRGVHILQLAEREGHFGVETASGVCVCA